MPYGRAALPSSPLMTNIARQQINVPAVSPGRPPLHRIIAQIAGTSLGLCFVRHIGDRIDPTLIRLSRGRVSTVWPLPAVLVTHTGAKTRTNVLVYFTDHGRVILIATNFGAARNPPWYYNFKNNPIVQLDGRHLRGRFAAQEVHGANATASSSGPRTQRGLTADIKRPPTRGRGRFPCWPSRRWTTPSTRNHGG